MTVNVFVIGPPSYRGSYKITVVCPSVCPSACHPLSLAFFSEMAY